MVYTRPAHGDPFADSSATDATVIIDALADGLETAESTIALKANIASPTFTGAVTVPTPATSSNTTEAASTAMVHANTMVTHPNATDKLVRVWDTTTGALSTVFYDSGWREVYSLLDAATISASSNPIFQIRRINNTVHFHIGDITFATAASTQDVYVMPDGFRPYSVTAGRTYLEFWSLGAGSATGYTAEFGGATSPYGFRVVQKYRTNLSGTARVAGNSSYPTNDAIPASLPGTNSLSAPA